METEKIQISKEDLTVPVSIGPEAALALRGRYGTQIVPSKKDYKRKPKHKNKELDDL